MDATHENPVVGRVGGRGWNSDEMRMRQRVKLHLKGAEGNNIRHFQYLLESLFSVIGQIIRQSGSTSWRVRERLRIVA
jgi:hypothetical protein